MSKIKFISKLKTHLTAFLKYKHKLGIPYRNGAYYLALNVKHFFL